MLELDLDLEEEDLEVFLLAFLGLGEAGAYSASEENSWSDILCTILCQALQN